MRTTIETNEGEAKVQATGALAKCTELCRAAARKLRLLEEQLTEKLAAEMEGIMPHHLLRQAMNEAEALAWTTRYPLLFLPDLAEEKVQSARQWTNRQQQIFRL
jgi:hypothetical protein